MIKLQKDSYALKEAETTKRAATILKDTELLKRERIPDLLTSVDNVDERLYIKVRFHRMTPTRKKETDDIFRSKKSGKDLDTNDYAYNLKVYFEQTRRFKNISLVI